MKEPMQNRLFINMLTERTSSLTKEREKLNIKIINKIIEMKLYKENIFIKYIKKIKFIIKNFFNNKKNDNIEIEPAIDVLKYNFNKNEINATDFKIVTFIKQFS